MKHYEVMAYLLGFIAAMSYVSGGGLTLTAIIAGMGAFVYFLFRWLEKKY